MLGLRYGHLSHPGKVADRGLDKLLMNGEEGLVLDSARPFSWGLMTPRRLFLDVFNKTRARFNNCCFNSTLLSDYFIIYFYMN